jgi:hypothetical protein
MRFQHGDSIIPCIAHIQFDHAHDNPLIMSGAYFRFSAA